MTTTLDWPDLRNARDLGGIAVASGGRIRERALIRTDNHDRLDVTGLAALRAYGVSRVVDLRAEWEAARYPSPLAADPFYRLAPAAPETMPDEFGYLDLVDESRTRVTAALAAVADAPPGAVVVHCHAGRDRTGVVVALALHLAGATREAIAADYVRSGRCEATAITDVLDHLTIRYGGVTTYLLDSGLTPAQITRLQGRLTLPRPETVANG